MDGVTLLAGLLIVGGLAGIVVPVLPGLVLVWAGVLLWASERQDAVGWSVLVLATVVTGLGVLAKYLLPGRRLRDAGVPWWTLTVATVTGVVGFFVVPVVGLFLGFVLGVYAAETVRLRDAGAAWASARRALGAVGWSILIELATGLIVASVWLGAVLLG